jgi:site-specific DNA recombinase
LIGWLFDNRGNRMSPSHARKDNVKYRYYLSSALVQGTAACAGSVRRVPATEIEALVIKSIRDHLKPSQFKDFWRT